MRSSAGRLLLWGTLAFLLGGTERAEGLPAPTQIWVADATALTGRLAKAVGQGADFGFACAQVAGSQLLLVFSGGLTGALPLRADRGGLSVTFQGRSLAVVGGVRKQYGRTVLEVGYPSSEGPGSRSDTWALADARDLKGCLTATASARRFPRRCAGGCD